MKHEKWVQVEYEESVESYMVDLHFYTAAPGFQEMYFALDERELKEMLLEMRRALRLKERQKKKLAATPRGHGG